jgi:hypothetical protein
MTGAPRVEEQALSYRETDELMFALSMIDRILPGETIGLVRSIDGHLHIIPTPDVNAEDVMLALSSCDWSAVGRLAKLKIAKRRK